MGKRELVLIAGFVLLGVAAYWVTAPPADEGEDRMSLRRLARTIQGEVWGERASEPIHSSAHATPLARTTIVEIGDFDGALIVRGHPDGDLTAAFEAEAYALEAAEAAAVAKEARVAFEADGEVARLALDLPGGRSGRAISNRRLVVDVPARMHLRLSDVGGKVEASVLAAVTLEDIAAEIRITGVDGSVTGTTRGSLDVSGVGLVDVETTGGQLVVTDVSGAVTLRVRRAAVYLSRVRGPITLETRGADVDVDGNVAPLVVDGRGGKLILHDAQAPVTVEAENLLARIAMARAVPVTLTTSGRPLDVLLPPGAAVLIEATVRDGDLVVPRPLKVDVTGDTRRAHGALGEGGPPVLLTNRRGDIIVRLP